MSGLPFAAIVFAMTHPTSVQSDRFLACIVAVEGTKSTAPGGIFGLSAATWRQHSHLPYRYTAFKDQALYVAEKHLRWLEDSLRADGFDPTPYRLGICWRHGFEGGKKLFNDPREGYGARVNNLYHSSHKLSL